MTHTYCTSPTFSTYNAKVDHAWTSHAWHGGGRRRHQHTPSTMPRAATCKIPNNDSSCANGLFGLDIIRAEKHLIH